MANYEKIETGLKDCFILVPKRFGDDRGYFESVTNEQLRELGFNDITQISNSQSDKGIIRGLHYQRDPYCQAKVVRCHRGEVIDVVVDIRKDSPTYGKSISVKLTTENGRLLYVPRGFAHGYVALQDKSLFEYYVDNEYMPRTEGGILWNDPDLNINWDEILKECGVNEPILSAKDKVRLPLKDTEIEFRREPRRYFITGVEGQLGFDIVRELHRRGEKCILAPKLADLDITDYDKVHRIISEYKPDIIFHCAAWTQVDKAEYGQGYDMAREVNGRGTQNIAAASAKVGAKLVYISTDYVYDGQKDGIYTEEDETNPLSVYGETKLLGERLTASLNPRHFIARTSWVFGVNGKNFIRTMVNLSEGNDELEVVNDQVGSPTYTVDLAKTLVEMAHTEKYGIYHINNNGFCSWAELASNVMDQIGSKTRIIPVTTEEYYKNLGIDLKYIAKRPLNSRLSKDKLVNSGFALLPDWQSAVSRYLDEYYFQQKGVQRKHSKGDKN